MAERVMIEAEVTFLPKSEGGREHLNVSFQNCHYRPHLALGDPTLRKSDALNESYLGVEFTDGPSHLEPNQPVKTKMAFLYWPKVNYEGAKPGATFTIREDPRIVAFGEITKRWAESTP